MSPRKKIVNGNTYQDICLYFRPEYQNEKNAYDFLYLLGRKKTAFVADVIMQYLKSKGVTDVSDLTSEQAKLLASESFLNINTASSMSLPMELLLKMFSEQMTNQTSISQPVSQTTAIPQEDVPVKKEKKPVKKKEPIKKELDIPVNETIKQFDGNEDDDDLFANDDIADNDDFTMNDNILRGLSSFGIFTK